MNQLPGKVFKRILIIGSSSFLAKELINKLSNKNLVICLDKSIKRRRKKKKYNIF